MSIFAVVLLLSIIAQIIKVFISLLLSSLFYPVTTTYFIASFCFSTMVTIFEYWGIIHIIWALIFSGFIYFKGSVVKGSTFVQLLLLAIGLSLFLSIRNESFYFFHRQELLLDRWQSYLPYIVGDLIGAIIFVLLIRYYWRPKNLEMA